METKKPQLTEGEWWELKPPAAEPPQPSQQLTPMPLPQMPGPQAEPPRSWGPVPWQQYVTYPSQYRPPAEPEPAYPQPPPTTQAPDLMGAMSQLVAPQIEARERARPAYIPTDPSSVLADTVHSPQYVSELAQLYQELAQSARPGRAVTPMQLAMEQRARARRAGDLLAAARPLDLPAAQRAIREVEEAERERERAALWGPELDPAEPIEELRARLRHGRESVRPGDLLANLAAGHEENARLYMERGQEDFAVREMYLARAAQQGAVPYLGGGLKVAAGLVQQAAGRYIGQPRSWMGFEPTTRPEFESLSEAQLAESAALFLAEEARAAEELPLSHQVVRAVTLPFVRGREEARWNPEGLPVVRKPSDVRVYMVARYGDTEQARHASAWAESITWSGAASMLRAAERIYAGEDPFSVIMGHTINLTNPTDRDIEVVLAYKEAAQAHGVPDEVIAETLRRAQRIPGEADGWRQFIGEWIFDPVNWAFRAMDVVTAERHIMKAHKFWTKGNLSATYYGDGTVQFEQAGKVVDVMTQADFKARWAQAVAEATGSPQAGAAAAEGMGGVAQAAKAAKAAGEAVGPLTRAVQKFNPFALTPAALATRATEPATIMATTLSTNVRNAEAAKEILTALADFPPDLARMGLLPSSIASSTDMAEMQPLFKEVLAHMDQWPSMQAEEFNVAYFTADLAQSVRMAADDLYDVERPKSLLEASSDAVRDTMRHAWMTGWPPYTIRNMSGDLGTMAYDHLVALHNWKHVREYLDRVQGVTGRIYGTREGGPVPPVSGAIGELPLIGPALQYGRGIITYGEIIPGRPTIAGEEIRAAMAWMVSHQRANAQWWAAYQLPDGLQETLGPTRARILRSNLMDAVNLDEGGLAVGEFVSNRMAKLSVDAYMSEPTALSPAMKADMGRRLAQATTPEEVTNILNDAREEVLSHTDQMIAEGLNPPMRKIDTEMGDTQDMQETVLQAGAMAKQFGVDDATALQGEAQIQEAIRRSQQVALEAERRAVRLVQEHRLSEEHSRAVLMELHSAIEEGRRGTRAALDQYRKETRATYREHPEQGTELWERFRQDTTNAWDEFRLEASRGREWADDVIGRLEQGERLEDVLPDDRPGLREATERYAHLYQQLADQEQEIRLASGEALNAFERKLQLNRLGEDAAADVAWRMAVADPSTDAIDVLYSAQRDIDELARVARAKHDSALAALDNKELAYSDYLAAVDAAWEPFWDQAPHRWMLAASEIANLQGLDEVVTPSAFQAIAKEAGVEIADLAAIGRDGWEKLTDAAARKTSALTNKIAREQGVHDVSAASRTEVMRYPANEDDFARSYGYDPTTMTPSQWTMLADAADVNRNRWLQKASETGRQEAVAQISGRQPEYGVGALADEMVTAGALSRREERELLAQLTRETREQETRFTTHVLREAGYSQEDLADLNLQQKQRLLEELGQGAAHGDLLRTPAAEVSEADLLRTPSGNISRIGGLAPERRQAVLRTMPPGVRELVAEYFVGTGQDPLNALAYQWERVAQGAREWAELVEAGVVYENPLPEGYYNADGYPILRTEVRPVEELGEKVTEWQRLLDEYSQVERFIAQRYEAWQRADFDETTRPMSGNWMAATGEQVIAADEMATRGGMTTPPRLGERALMAEKDQLEALDEILEALLGEWEEIMRGREEALTPEQITEVRKWFKEEFIPLNNARSLLTAQAARNQTDFALFDYADRRNFDTWLSIFIPYHFWYTRTVRNWGLRLAANPAILGNYLNYKHWSRQINEERQYPSRLEGMVEIPAEFLPEWTGQRLFVDPLRYAWPFNSLTEPYNFENPAEAENAVDLMYRTLGMLGMDPFPHLKLAMIKSGLVSTNPDEIYNFVPQTAPVQSLTAIAHQAGADMFSPRGLYLEGWIRRGLGMIEGAPGEPYLVDRSLIGMELNRIAEGDPSQLHLTYMAMELMEDVAFKRLRFNDALGISPDPVDPQTAATYTSEQMMRLAKEKGWTPEELKSAQLLLAEGVTRAHMERSVTTLSALTGMPVYLYSQGEERARELQRETRAQMHSPLLEAAGLPSGSREQWLAHHEEKPEAWLRPLSFATLPGMEEYEIGPEERRKLLVYNAERERVDQDYEERIDEYIRGQPWDTAGAAQLRLERSQVLDQLRQEIMRDEYDEQTLWSVYGATPAEREKRRREQVISIIAWNEPKLDEFMDPTTGDPDYDAWEQAKDTYYELGVHAILEADPAIQEMLLDMPIKETVLERLPITERARQELQRRGVYYAVGTGSILAGGGGWFPETGEIQLNGGQWEAAIHETAHAWWHEEREDLEMVKAFVQAFLDFAEGSMRWDEYAEAHELAQVYVNGHEGWEQGMREQDLQAAPTGWNDWEIYAGLASAVMGDLSKIPPELRPFYDGFLSGEQIIETQTLSGEWDVLDRLQEVVGRLTTADITAYRRRNDTPLEAAQRTYGELYSMAWEAYNDAVEDGLDKGVAYNTYIRGLPEMHAGALIPAIQERYPDRWGDDELREALQGVRWPTGDEVHVLRKPQAEQELARAQDEFYEYLRWYVPPGEFEYALRDAVPMLNAIRDWSTREALAESGFTADQYRIALNQMKAYVGRRVTEGSPQEWGFARGMNRIFSRFREQKFPGIGDLLAFRAENWAGPYLTTEERAGREAFDAQHPELEAYRQWEWAFAQEHPVWAQYYKPWLLEQEEPGVGEAAAPEAKEATEQAERATAQRAGGGGYYYGGESTSRIGTWADFAALTDVDTLTALFGHWGRGESLSGSARSTLQKLHEQHGWGEFSEWLSWLQRLYQSAFAYQARDVPRAQYTHWLPGLR